MIVFSISMIAVLLYISSQIANPSLTKASTCKSSILFDNPWMHKGFDLEIEPFIVLF